MIKLAGWIAEQEADSIRMLMQVHDELVFEVREDLVEAYLPSIRTLMSEAAALAVPLEVGIGVGDNWDEAH
jgi:DNA polymerase-1